jgi:hypothetical protein
VSAVKKIVSTAIGFASLLISIAPAFGQSAIAPYAEPTPIITARTQVFVEVPHETLARAEEVASEILLRAGIEVTWITCDFTIPSGSREPGCSRPLSSLDFFLNIVDRLQALSPKLSEIAMGVAVVPSEGAQGDTAYLGLRQAANVAHVSSLPLETVLGLGAAHEMGHLLLGENAHSPSGLMKARWGNDELNLGLHGNLIFLPEQVDRIRTNLLAREKKTSNSAIAIGIGASAGDVPQAGPNCSSCSSMPINPVIRSD